MTGTETYPWAGGFTSRPVCEEDAPLTSSDHALAQRAGRGDVEAFEELYRRHNSRVYSVCLRIAQNASVAEDLTQEVFIQLYRKIASFRGESALTTYLHRMAVNQALMHLRKSGVRWEQTTEDGAMPERARGRRETRRFGVRQPPHSRGGHR
ncbi:MAG: sigma-70 family RNA polymerase sigma factor [Pyrinomonadaceae bacterium]